jgi:hypothetical protein
VGAAHEAIADHAYPELLSHTVPPVRWDSEFSEVRPGI